MSFTISAVVLVVLILISVLTIPVLRRFFTRAVSGLCLLLIGKYIGLCTFSSIGVILTLLLGIPGALTFFAVSGLLK